MYVTHSSIRMEFVYTREKLFQVVTQQQLLHTVYLFRPSPLVCTVYDSILLLFVILLLLLTATFELNDATKPFVSCAMLPIRCCR